MMKRSITIARHRTSVSMEEPFWQALGEIARLRRMSVAAMISEIDRKRLPESNLSSALRLYVLDWFRTRAEGCRS
jgi:predicted DNA-binding ribbon-helix-helix protein